MKNLITKIPIRLGKMSENRKDRFFTHTVFILRTEKHYCGKNSASQQRITMILPEQLNPSPLYPALQVQLMLPAMFVQVAN